MNNIKLPKPYLVLLSKICKETIMLKRLYYTNTPMDVLEKVFCYIEQIEKILISNELRTRMKNYEGFCRLPKVSEIQEISDDIMINLIYQVRHNYNYSVALSVISEIEMIEKRYNYKFQCNERIMSLYLLNFIRNSEEHSKVEPIISSIESIIKLETVDCKKGNIGENFLSVNFENIDCNSLKKLYMRIEEIETVKDENLINAIIDYIYYNLDPERLISWLEK